ncbi:MAG: phosphatase domain-containing protein [Burkholderiales bacterium]
MKIAPLLALLGFLALPAVAEDELALQLYPAVGDTRGFTIEGRVIERRELRDTSVGDRWWTNLWRNLRQLINDEEAGAAVTVRIGQENWTAKTDAEGYFKIDVETRLAGGWQAVAASATNVATQASGSLLIVPAENKIGIISDLDDTLLISEVNDKSDLLSNTFMKNALQRAAVPGAAQFLARSLAGNLHPDTAAMIYLSASPRQLSTPIENFLAHNGFPRGVLITKKVTNDATSDPITDQVAYKTAKLESIFARLPHVKFILLGDDGEKDPEIFHAIRARYPNRVRSIWIRHVHPDPSHANFDGQQNLNEAFARQASMPVDH